MEMLGGLSVMRPDFDNCSPDEKEWCKNFYMKHDKLPIEDWLQVVVFHFHWSYVLRCPMIVCWEICTPKRFNFVKERGIL